MEVHLSDIQRAKLEELAVETGRGTEELVREAVDLMLAGDEYFR